jgi:hypothetical protein
MVYKAVDDKYSMILYKLEEARLAIAQAMNTDIANSAYFYLDFWGITHVMVGFAIMWVLIKYKVFGRSRSKQYLAVFTLAALWESFEWYFYSKGIFFAVDTPANVGWDFFANMLGAWLYLKFAHKREFDNSKK